MKFINPRHLKTFLFIILYSSFQISFCQVEKDSILKEKEIKIDTFLKKTNPIIFGDFSIGYTNGNLEGIGLYGTLYYQHKNDLFSFRAGSNIEIIKIEWVFFFPVNVVSNTFDEYSLMYGKRFIEDGFSYHFQGGISYGKYTEKNMDIENVVNYVGFPIEVGLHWFKAKKKRFRVFYGLIPVGKPTAFGRSFGFKLYANINKRPYVGLGINFGIGWHKKY